MELFQEANEIVILRISTINLKSPSGIPEGLFYRYMALNNLKPLL